jgi:hypothetical protein
VLSITISLAVYASLSPLFLLLVLSLYRSQSAISLDCDWLAASDWIASLDRS